MPIAFLMVVLAGTEQAAQAVSTWTGVTRAEPGDAPGQTWGSARGRAHEAPLSATEASASGGRDGATRAPSELPLDERPFAVAPGAEPQPPAMGPVEVVDAPTEQAPRGFDARTSAELADEREEQARTYRNTDGTYTTRFYNKPVNFRSADGTWREIDTTLVRPDGAATMSGSDSAWEPRSAGDAITFAEYADSDPVVRVGLGERLSVGYALEGAARSRGAVDGSVITYPEVRSSTDLELLAGSDSVKETLILKDSTAPTRWRFPLALEGLSAHPDGYGGVEFVDADGRPQARMPSGWMADSRINENANEGAVSSGVTYSLAEESGRQTLVVSLDEEWLKDPERVFPVRVDPSVKSVDATSGTYVEAPYNQNFSSDAVLKVGTYDSGTHKAAAFLRFAGLETTLKNAWVISADLALYNTWSQSCTARPVTIHPITSNWAEASTTKYPGPATGASLASKSFAHGWRPANTTTWSCGAAWETVKLGSAGRTLVDDWTHGRKKNYGLAVKASVTDSKGWKQFGSDDYPNGKPSLDVTWTKYGAAYKLGGFVKPVTATSQGSMKVTVTNQGQATWPKGGNYKLRYNLYNAAGTEITDSAKIRWTAMPSAVAPGQSVTLEAAIAPLAPASYTLVWTMDDVGVSRFSSAGVPGPAVKFDAVNIPPQLTREAPASGVTLNSLTPTLWAEGKDPDASPGGALQYTFEVCEVSDKDARKNCRSGARGTAKQWAVPGTWLTWGKTYAWYAYVYDGKATSTRPAPAFFTTQVPQPAVTAHLGGDNGREFGSRAGNYSTTATDAALSAVGPELAVHRTYNSLDPRGDTVFGRGWASRWDMRLREEPTTNSVLITLADGSRVRFGGNPDGSYAGPSGGVRTLAREADGWVLREKSGTTYHFGSGGLLGSVTDGAGRRQVLRYQDEDGGSLKSVTDALSGRSLAFTWSQGRVATVTTSAVTSGGQGLTWTYSYQGDRLTRVCPPASTTACSVYTYEDGSLYRSTVMDENPVSYWRLGETEGSNGVSESPSATGLNEISYRDLQLGQDGALAGTTDLAAGFDGTDSLAELPGNTLSTSTFLSVEMWFRTTGSGVLMGFQDGPLDDGEPDDWNPVLAVDNTGKLRGEFLGSATAAPITTTRSVADNAWHQVVLTGAGTTQTMYLDGATVGSLTGPIDHRERTYTYLGAGWSSPGWDGEAAGVRRFTGQLDDVAVYHHPLDAGTVAEHFAARAATGRITQVVSPSGRVHAKVGYDAGNGRVTETTDQNGGTWKVSQPSYSSASSSYAQTVTASKPLGYWRLGERSGATAVSAVGEGMDGSYLDGTHLGAAGVFADGDDTSVTFDGDTSQGAVEVPVEALGTKSTASLELWFRTAKQGVLLSMQDKELGETPGQWRPMLVVDSAGKLRGRFTASGTSAISTTVVTDENWHHAVLTAHQGQQYLYVDGSLEAVTAGSGDTARWDHVYIGGGYTSPGWDGGAAGYRNFQGQIDEVALYDKSLMLPTTSGVTNAREQEISGHYHARNSLVMGDGDTYRGGVVSDAPAAYWRFGETAGTRLAGEMAASDSDATFHAASEGGSAPTAMGATGAFGPGSDHAVRLGGKGYVEFPPAVFGDTSDLAVEMWFKTSSAGVLLGTQNTVMGTTPTSWRPILNIDQAGKLRGEFWLSGVSGATPITSGQAVTDGDWHHVVLSASGTTQSLYLDSVLVGTLNGTRVDPRVRYAYFGGGYASQGWMGVASGTYYITGQIDEPAVYQHALSADQVSAHYQAQARSTSLSLGASVTVTDPTGRTTAATYDMLRGQRKAAESDAEGGVTTYAYDSGGYLHTVTDPAGHSTVTGHDARGNTVSTTTCRDSHSCWTAFTDYHLNSADPLDPRNDRPVAIRDARSANPTDNRYRTALTYTALGLPSTTVLADGRSSSTTYTTGSESAVGGGKTPAGLVASQKSPATAATTYAYYSNGDLARSTAPSGLVTTYTYDGLGRKLADTQVSDTFPAGVTTSYGYDSMSRLTGETGTGVKNEITGTVHTANVTRTFDDDGRLLTEATADTTGGDTGRITTYHYDDHGLNDRVTDAEGSTTTLGHDATGRVTEEKDAAGNRLVHTYTKGGRHAETVLKDWMGAPSGQPQDLVLVSNAYDPAGRLATTTDAMGATTAYTYFDDGLPATTTARQVGRADGTKHDIVLESLSYDGAGHATRQVTGGGRTTVTSTVDATGRTTRTVLDPNGLNRVTTYAYDGDDRVTEQTRSVDSADGKLTSTATYDTAGNLVTSTLTDGTGPRVTTQKYDQRGLLVSGVSPRGNATGADVSAHTTTIRYDALGRPVQQTAPKADAEEHGGSAEAVRATTLTGYNTFGEATDTKDARGAVTHTGTDRLGRATIVTLPGYTPPGRPAITSVSRTEYDTLGNVSATVDPLGRTTRYGYDQLGRLIRRTDPVADAPGLIGPSSGALNGPVNGAQHDLDGAGVTSYTWTPTGLQLSETDPTGARNEATYDELGQQLTATTVERHPVPRDLTTRYTWDDAGNQLSAATPGNHTTSAGYNAVGEVETVTDPMGGVTRLGYDGLGRRTQVTDATGRRSTTEYDALGNILKQTDFGTGTTALRSLSAEFDLDGNRTASVSAGSARTTYTYDALGRLTRRIEPVSAGNSITTSFGYDASGNLTRLTDGRGNATIYTFTPWNQLESTVEPATAAHPAAADRTWTTVYDAAGRSVLDTLPGGIARTRTYDGLDRMTAETGTGAEAATVNRSLEYDLAGRLTAIGTDGQLGRDTYTYNDRGQLLTAAGPGGSSSYAYDDDGNMTMRTNKGITTEFGYDAAGRLDWTWDQATGNDIWYGFDAAGRPSTERYAEKPAGASAWQESARRSYGYDSLGRLTSDRITDPAGTTDTASTRYEYDVDDRLTKKSTTGTTGAAAQTYGYDLAGRMTSWSAGSTVTEFGWDAAANRVKAGGATATYDARNRLLTDGTSSYAYSSRGTLSSVTTPGQSSRSVTFDAFERKITDGGRTFAYDSLDRLSGSGAATFSYDGGSNNLANDGTSHYTRTPDGSLLTVRTGTAGQWAVTDQHTDLTATLSADGRTVTGSTAYGPFGTKTSTQGTTPSLGYQSGWTDPASGDVNMAARWYQPGTGGFSSRDTWQLSPDSSAQSNRYLYGNGDPNNTDPSGHQVCVLGVCSPKYIDDGIRQAERYANAGARAVGRNSGKAIGIGGRLFGVGVGALIGILAGATPLGDSSCTGRYGMNCTAYNALKNGTSLTTKQRFCDTHSWTTQCGGGRTTPGRRPTSSSSGGGYVRYVTNSSSGYGNRGGSTTCSNCYIRVSPPPPPIDQNPNNGAHPVPAPDRPKAKVDWDPREAGWKPGDGWDMVVTGAQMMALGNSDQQYTPGDESSLALLGDMFPEEVVGPDLGHGLSGANPNASRTRDRCSRDFPSKDPAFYYAPMTRFGPQPDDCRATGAVAHIDSYDLRPWRLDPKWKPAGYERLPVGNRAALHLLGNQMGGANDTLRNFVAGYQTPANSPHMRSLEDDVTSAVRSGQSVTLGVLPVYRGADPAIPSEIKMYSVGNKGYRMNCTIYNRPTGGYSCSERSSGGNLSVP